MSPIPTFQTSIAQYVPLGVEGMRASANPTATVDAGGGGFVADLVNGLNTGRFAWADPSTNSRTPNPNRNSMPPNTSSATKAYSAP